MQVKAVPVSENVLAYCDGYWEWFTYKTGEQGVITGKYLFFSADREVLKQIAIDEIEHHDFRHAKIPMEGKNKSNEYVLCLYYRDDHRKGELAERYSKRNDVKYRYWKSDEATRRGEYSKEFLEQIPEDQRKRWTSKH
jgi:hypothetical protein